jgi:hypothetical protein
MLARQLATQLEASALFLEECEVQAQFVAEAKDRVLALPWDSAPPDLKIYHVLLPLPLSALPRVFLFFLVTNHLKLLSQVLNCNMFMAVVQLRDFLCGFLQLGQMAE